MTAGAKNNHSKFSKATKLTNFMIYIPVNSFLHKLHSPGFDINKNLDIFSTKPSALPARLAVENGCLKLLPLSKCSVSTQAFL